MNERADLSVLGIVTARGGSKGIPRKNLRELLGRSLISWTAEVALASRLDRVILSTDTEEIAREGVACGLEVPFLRPARLASDSAPTIPVVQMAVDFLAKKGSTFDAVFVLQPTNPLRILADIDGSIALMEETGCDSVIGYSKVVDSHPARMKTLDANGVVLDPPFAEDFEGQPRQELPTLYLRNGAVYLTKIDVLMEQSSLKGAVCRPWLIPSERAVNIDTEFDLFVAEQALRFRGHQAG